MSIELSLSYPKGLSAKTQGVKLPVTGRGHERKQLLMLGDYEIPMEDFCELALYVLTNTDLDKDDPRVALVDRVRAMKVVDGYNKIVGNDSHSVRLAMG